jgi:hypothetical protein
MGLQGKNEPETRLDIFEQLATDPTGGLDQEIPIDRDDLGNVRHGVSWKPGAPGREEYVARSIEDASVGAQNDGDHSLETAPVERIVLDDQDGPFVSRF